MSCYVDPLFDTRGWSADWPYPFACHLMADSDEELHAMAGRLGLRRAWHQTRPPHSISHYDLTVRKRARAVQLGAIEVDMRFMPERERVARHPILCEICRRGPAPEHGSIGVHRQNAKGQPGIWRCDAHNELPVDPIVQEIIDAIEGE